MPLYPPLSLSLCLSTHNKSLHLLCWSFLQSFHQLQIQTRGILFTLFHCHRTAKRKTLSNPSTSLFFSEAGLHYLTPLLWYRTEVKIVSSACQVMKVWIGLNWLGIRPSDERLWRRWWIFGLNEVVTFLDEGRARLGCDAMWWCGRIPTFRKPMLRTQRPRLESSSPWKPQISHFLTSGISWTFQGGRMELVILYFMCPAIIIIIIIIIINRLFFCFIRSLRSEPW
jgi:hypothetical protein